MNLQTIQKRIEELSAELVTISADLAFLIAGDVVRDQSPVINPNSYWAEGMRKGDRVKCVAITSTNEARLRSFTLGNIYTVENRMVGQNPRDSYYGIRVLRDDEGDGHCAEGVIFVKVGE